MTDPKTHTLDVPGAVLTYDVRSNDTGTHPVLLIIGSPMGASGFVTLASHFTFPGDHGGFLGGEYGQTGEPDAFAATLHKVLAD